jgi:glycosyltransferase involved in cell wall biosynthesis
VVLPYKKVYQSGVLMMTLSYEKPALVSNLPPLKEILKDNENGFLFESENPSSLAEKINCILSDEKQWEIVRKNGAKLIKTAYSWDEIGKQTKEAYQTL